MLPCENLELRDKYTRTEGKAYLTGIQALVRLPLDQMRLDRRAGLQMGTLISGYEGSPLGGYDLALAKERKLLAEHEIHHWPAVNEDLGATAIYGSQIHASHRRPHSLTHWSTGIAFPSRTANHRRCRS